MLIFGIIAFALGITVSIALHEAGHMCAAKTFGMKVRTFAIGMGPALASHTPRNSETAYKLAAFPIGGYCDIAGMTALDEDPGEKPMYTQPLYQRVIVLAAGILVNFMLGFAILVATAMSVGIPNYNADLTPQITEITAASPADNAKLHTGDYITAIDGDPVTRFVDVADMLAPHANTTTTVTTTNQSGQSNEHNVHVSNEGTIGVRMEPKELFIEKTGFDIRKAVAQSLAYSKRVIVSSVQGILALPSYVKPTIDTILGKQERDLEGPVSVIGASHIGGQLAQNNQWGQFALVLANLNYFLALFNVVPLPPLDGGHIVINIYGAIRDRIRTLRGKAPLVAVDYRPIQVVTAIIFVAMLLFGLLIIAADITNPITLP